MNIFWIANSAEFHFLAGKSYFLDYTRAAAAMTASGKLTLSNQNQSTEILMQDGLAKWLFDAPHFN